MIKRARLWEWLRVGKRIEWISLAEAILFWLVFAIPAAREFWGETGVLAIIFGGIAGFVLTLVVPSYFYLRFQRNKAGPPPLENAKVSPPGPISRLRLYGFLVVLTLASATVQAYRLKPDQRPFGLSPLELYLWNLGILAALLVYLEVRRRNQSPE